MSEKITLNTLIAERINDRKALTCTLILVGVVIAIVTQRFVAMKIREVTKENSHPKQ